MTHPATLKADLRHRLDVDRVVTVPQLERWGLRQAAAWLNLPTLALTVQLRSNDAGSDRDTELVGRTEADLNHPHHHLMHLALLAEIRHLHDERGGWLEQWHHLSAAGRPRGSKPDAEILCRDWHSGDPLDRDVPVIVVPGDVAVEADAGYSWGTVERKLEQAAADGYVGVLWGTTIHIHPGQLGARARALHAAGGLRGLQWVEALYINPVEPDPYRPRPRVKRKMLRARINLGPPAV